MRMMRTTTAQSTPIMIIFCREVKTERDKGRMVLMTGSVSIEMSPQPKHRLKLCATNSIPAQLCLLSSNQRQGLKNRRKNTHPRTSNTYKHTSSKPPGWKENKHTPSLREKACKSFSKACFIPAPIVALQRLFAPVTHL